MSRSSVDVGAPDLKGSSLRRVLALAPPCLLSVGSPVWQLQARGEVGPLSSDLPTQAGHLGTVVGAGS